MGLENVVKMNIKGLEQMKAQLDLAKKARVRIGILGDAARSAYPDGTSMAEVAFKSEFGFVTTGHMQRFDNSSPIGDQLVPARSFLRMPVGGYSSVIIGRVSNQFAKAIWDGKFLGWLRRLGYSARNQVDKAFASAGFGMWSPNTPFRIAQKGSAQPLIDTGELRHSVSSDVVVDDVTQHD